MKKYLFILAVLGFLGCESYDLKIVESYSMKRGGFEPSGVTFFEGKFYIVGDEGKIAVFKNGKIKYKKIKRGLDLEGITNDGKNLYLVDEKKHRIIKIGKDFKIDRKFEVDRKFEGRKFLKKGVDGFEGITFLKEDGDGKHFLLAVQEPKKGKLVFVTLKNDKVKVDRVKKMKIKDISGLFYKDGKLYLLSDKENRIYLYNLKDFKLLKKYKIPGRDQEGIAVLKDEFYIADDSGKFFRMRLK
ncbi:MAG: hypothetical protein GXO31_02880 [Epsilonproteobacteria bacterium]|nr:hypothetical protein [Campylobacterota bacterium]